MRAATALAVIALITALEASMSGHALTVGIVGNDVLYDQGTLEKASSKLTRLCKNPVRIEFAYLPPSTTGLPPEDTLERAARVIKESDVLIMPIMGTLTDQYWRLLSEKVVGTPLPRDLAILAFQSRKRFFALISTGERRQSVVAGKLRPKIKDLEAVAANLSFLLSCSSDPTPALAFALWCIGLVPTNALPLPPDVSKAFLAVYVPSRGWLGPKVDVSRLVHAYRDWLRKLESGKAGLSIRLRYITIPSWAEVLVDETRKYARSFVPPTRSPRLVVVLNHVEYFHTPDGRRLTELVTDAIDRRVRDLGISAVAVCGTVKLVPGLQVVAGWKDKGYEVLAFVKLSAFASLYPTPATWSFHDLDTPVIKPVLPLRGDEECEPARYCRRRWGPMLEWAIHVWGGPELEGSFWFFLPALKKSGEPGFLPIRSGIEALANEVRGIVSLRLKPNKKKRVLYVLYCYPPGRGSIGATYLDVFESMIEILAHMAERGYDVGPARDVLLRLVELERSNPKAAKEYRSLLAHVLMEVSDLLLKNVGPWAKGELDQMARLYLGEATAERSFRWKDGREIRIKVERGRVLVEGLTDRPVVFCTVGPDQLVPVSVAEKWFRRYLFDVLEEYRKLIEECNGPERKQALDALNDIVRRLKKWWGEPSDNKGYMIWHGRYVIPCVKFGNVGIALQPPRGWSGNPSAIYHDPNLPPHWQYIAFYYWVKEGFHADAIVHVGTHGTLEWLPGHEFALLGTDWPYLLLRDVPHLYIYIISNPGEGKQAKYRSGPVMLTHLPPAWDYFRDIGKYNDVWRAVTDYMARRGYIHDEHILREMAKTVIEEAKKVGLYEEVCAKVGLNPEELERMVENGAPNWKKKFDEFVDELHDTIFDLIEQLVPYGLHTYGVPNGREVEQGALIALPSVAHYIAYWAGKIRAPSPEYLARWQSEDPDGFRLFQRKAAEFLEEMLKRLVRDPVFVKVARKYVEAMDDTYRLWRPDAEKTRVTVNLALENPDVRSTVRQVVTDEFVRVFGTFPVHFDEDDAVRMALEVYRVYVHYAESAPTEMKNLLRGLEGRFVEPGCPWTEPFWNPDALPTGRNGTIIDPRCIPTPEAWRVAVKLVDEMLADYYRKHGRWPDSVAVVIWGIHELITGGLGVATALYLLGVRPVWNPTTGRVMGVEPIPLKDLVVKVGNRVLHRPRIDVVVWSSGCFQDLIWPGRVLEEAFWLVSHLNEPPEWNHRRAHYLKAKRMLIEHGVDERTAEILASSACFSHPVGVYTSAGVNSVVEFDWTNATRGAGIRADVSPEERRKGMEKTFWERVQRSIESHMGYLYACTAKIVRVKFGDVERYLVLHETVTREVKGVHQVQLFRYLMSTVDAAVHNIVNVWGLLDCDDYYDWLGGINFYVYKLTGKRIDVYIQYAVNPSAARVRTLAEELAAEVRSKFLSESWMRALLEHGDYGWARLEKRMEYWTAWGIVAPQIAHLYNVLYSQVAKSFLHWLKTQGPITDFGGAAAQSILAWMVEAMRIGIWNPQPGLATQVIEAYLRYTAKYGPATCHHTSTNPLTIPFAVRYLALYAPEKLAELRPLVEAALRQYASLDTAEIAREIAKMLREVTSAAQAFTSRTSVARSPVPGVPGIRSSTRAQRSSVTSGRVTSGRTTNASMNMGASTSASVSTSYSSTSMATSTNVRTGSPGVPTGRRTASSIVGTVGAVAKEVAHASVPTAASAPGAGGTVTSSSGGRQTSRTSGKVASRVQASSSVSRSAKVMTRTSSAAVSPPRVIWIWVLALLFTVAIGWLVRERWHRWTFSF